MEHTTQSTAPVAVDGSHGGAAASQVPDVERIADAVYRLMLADTRLEQSRAGTITHLAPRR